jgi:MFS family permease
MRFGRAESFATTLLFVMLPQLSTVRVWFSSFQVPLSMALMLASMHWQLSFARTGKWGWLAGAVLAAVLSVGAYEAFAPLLVGFAIVLVFQAWRGSRDWRAVIAALFVLALLVLAFLYKLVLSGRAGPIGDPHRYVLGLYQLFRLDYDWRVDSGLNIVATPRAHFIAPAIGWWSGAKALMSGRSGLAVTAIAILVGAIAMWRLSNDGAQRSAPKPLLLLGITAFLLGNATFLIVPAVAFTSTGIDNRVQVAAALGVAMILASLICLAMNAVPVARRPIAFSVVIAVIGAAAFGRVAQIERYWAEAPALQQQVLSAARVDLRNVPEKATVILDGLCPYYGPAVVFETYWDIGGALSLALGRPVDGDAVSPRMSLTPGGLATSIYKAPSFYPYAPNLYVYDPMKHLLARLDSAAAATRYFGSRRQRACPGYVGRGVEV